MQAPSLKEIADMPLPASIAAVRRYYDSDWARFASEGEPREIVVVVDYEVTREDTFHTKVVAGSPEEAKKLALAELEDLEGKVDVDHIRFRDPHATRDHPSLFASIECAGNA